MKGERCEYTPYELITMEIIKDDKQILAKIIYEDDFRNVKFVSDNSDSLQVGVFCNDSGVDIVNHVHNIFRRETTTTQELIYLIKGKLKARVFTRDKKLVAERILLAPCMIYLIEGGHGFTVLDDDTIFFEAKNGPYFGVDIDKVKF